VDTRRENPAIRRFAADDSETINLSIRIDRVPPRGEQSFICQNARCASPGQSNLLQPWSITVSARQSEAFSLSD